MAQTSPVILSGRAAGAELISRIAARVRQLTDQGQRPPRLVVVQVGNDPASNAYIRQKEKAAGECGFHYAHAHLSAQSTFEELRAQILSYVNDATVDGIILQLPLDSEKVKDPQQVNELLHLIPAAKDADGLDTLNQGYVFTSVSTAATAVPAHPIPATALGTVRLLQHYGIEVSGKNAVVIGKSRLVGAPVAALLMHMGATVTVCHSKTRDLAAHTRQAELVVVCAGRKHLIRPEHLSPGVALIDVGIHVTEERKLTGDIHPDCHALSSAYSPVPGGVGPMTVAGLMENTLHLRLRQKT